MKREILSLNNDKIFRGSDLNPDQCIQCNNRAIKVKLITGDELEHWCGEHMKDAEKRAIVELGKWTFDFIFGFYNHNIWFWGNDIKESLSEAIINYFTEMSRDLYDIGDDVAQAEKIRVCAEILKIKAKEYHGTIEMSSLSAVENVQMIQMYVTEEYIKSIAGPLGQETQDIALVKIKTAMDNEPFMHLVSFILAAKRAERYIGQPHEKILITNETAIWQSHRQYLK